MPSVCSIPLFRELTEFYGKIIIGTRVAYWLACRLENTRDAYYPPSPLPHSPLPALALIPIGSAYANAAGATRFGICMQISCITPRSNFASLLSPYLDSDLDLDVGLDLSLTLPVYPPARGHFSHYK